MQKQADMSPTEWNIAETLKSPYQNFVINTAGTYCDKDIRVHMSPKAASLSFSEGDSDEGTNIEYSDTNVSGVISSSTEFGLTVSSEGWISEGEYFSSESSSKYVKGVTLSDSKQFEIHDGIWDWTWQKDENGNVYIY